MQLEKIERIAKGYVNFSVTDGFPETFFRECKKRDVPLFGVSAVKGSITAVARKENLSVVFDCAKKAGMAVHIDKRAGLPYMLARYRFRLGIPIGLLTAFVLFLFMTSVVWSVEISGNEAVSRYDIIEVLNENNVKVGSFTENIDCKAVELELCEQLDGVILATVNIFGCKIFVDITEGVAAPEITDEKQYTNLIAAKDGEIVRFDVLEGDGVVGVGMPVVKGDLLVSGVEVLKDNTVRYVHAKALVVARTSTVISTSNALNISAYKLTGISDRYLFYLFGLKIPLWFAYNGTDVYENKYLADTKNTVFPLGIIRQSSRDTVAAEISLTEEQGRLICLNDFALKAAEVLADTLIVDASASYNISNQIKIESKYTCEEDIVQELVFEVEEQQTT
ncbi:MAG: sporulation protein YqfD [Clostridia bacterium]|nr:sporulation protein YqfD [Clostridia bacterium]